MSGHIAHQGGLPQRTQEEEEANGTMSARYTRETIDSPVVIRIASLTNEPRTLTAEAIFGCPIYNVIIHRRPSEAIFGSPTEDPVTTGAHGTAVVCALLSLPLFQQHHTG